MMLAAYGTIWGCNKVGSIFCGLFFSKCKNNSLHLKQLKTIQQIDDIEIVRGINPK